MKKAIYVVGDIHGHYETLVKLLLDSNLIDDNLHWSGNQATLCLIGDYVDRGPRGIACVDLIMRLQNEAPEMEGQVIALIGNHEFLLMSAHLFGTRDRHGMDNAFVAAWLRNGGEQNDLESLTDVHIDWLKNLPAIALVGNRLLLHADALFYTTYGDSIDEINESFREVLEGQGQRIWLRLLHEFSERNVFHTQSSVGNERASDLLYLLGGEHLIHGHTPIPQVLKKEPKSVTAPFFYADNLCINVDGGIYLGGPGFIYQYWVDE